MWRVRVLSTDFVSVDVMVPDQITMNAFMLRVAHALTAPPAHLKTLLATKLFGPFKKQLVASSSPSLSLKDFLSTSPSASTVVTDSGSSSSVTVRLQCDFRPLISCPRMFHVISTLGEWRVLAAARGSVAQRVLAVLHRTTSAILSGHVVKDDKSRLFNLFSQLPWGLDVLEILGFQETMDHREGATVQVALSPATANIAELKLLHEFLQDLASDQALVTPLPLDPLESDEKAAPGAPHAPANPSNSPLRETPAMAVPTRAVPFLRATSEAARTAGELKQNDEVKRSQDLAFDAVLANELNRLVLEREPAWDTHSHRRDRDGGSVVTSSRVMGVFVHEEVVRQPAVPMSGPQVAEMLRARRRAERAPEAAGQGGLRNSINVGPSSGRFGYLPVMASTVRECGQECSICCDQVEFGDMIKRMPCMHWFHPHCIDRWLTQKPECPLCRLPLRTALALSF